MPISDPFTTRETPTRLRLDFRELRKRTKRGGRRYRARTLPRGFLRVTVSNDRLRVTMTRARLAAELDGTTVIVNGVPIILRRRSRRRLVGHPTGESTSRMTVPLAPGPEPLPEAVDDTERIAQKEGGGGGGQAAYAYPMAWVDGDAIRHFDDLANYPDHAPGIVYLRQVQLLLVRYDPRVDIERVLSFPLHGLPSEWIRRDRYDSCYVSEDRADRITDVLAEHFAIDLSHAPRRGEP